MIVTHNGELDVPVDHSMVTIDQGDALGWGWDVMAAHLTALGWIGPSTTPTSWAGSSASSCRRTYGLASTDHRLFKESVQAMVALL